MTALPGRPPASRSAPADLSTLLIWSAAQLFALGVSAFRVRLWARFPAAGESLAVDVLFCTQMATAVLLMPRLTRWRTAFFMLLTAWPLLMLAGSLAAVPGASIARAGAWISVWIVAMCLVARVQVRWQNLVWPSLVAWSLGGPFLVYLRNEFAGQIGDLSIFIEGPIVTGLRTLHGDARYSPLLISFFIAVVLAASDIALRRRRIAAPRFPVMSSGATTYPHEN